MKEYYFLASLLPPLEIGHVPELRFARLKSLLKINLSAEDYERTRQFLRQIDLENLRAYWANEPFDPRGNFNSEEVEQALIDMVWPGDEPFPIYLYDFLEKYHTHADRLKHFTLLISQFYQEFREGFLADYFTFQWEYRLVMVGFRAKRMGIDVVEQLQYEDPTDPIVAQILAQKDAKVYEPPFEYKELKPIFEEHANSPLELQRALYEYQFNHIIELWGGEIFTLDRIFNYMSRLLIIERWLDLDVQRGVEVIDNIERKVQ